MSSDQFKFHFESFMYGAFAGVGVFLVGIVIGRIL